MGVVFTDCNFCFFFVRFLLLKIKLTLECTEYLELVVYITKSNWSRDFVKLTRDHGERRCIPYGRLYRLPWAKANQLSGSQPLALNISLSLSWDDSKGRGKEI